MAPANSRQRHLRPRLPRPAPAKPLLVSSRNNERIRSPNRQQLPHPATLPVRHPPLRQVDIFSCLILTSTCPRRGRRDSYRGGRGSTPAHSPTYSCAQTKVVCPCETSLTLSKERGLRGRDVEQIAGEFSLHMHHRGYLS